MLSQFKNDMNEVVVERYEEVRLAINFSSEINNIARVARDLILLDKDKDSINESIQQIKHSRENSLILLDSLEKIANRQEVRVLLLKLNLSNNSHIEFQKELENLVLAGRKDEATQLILTGIKHRDQMFQMINEIVGSQERLMGDTLEQTNSSYLKAIKIYITLIILFLFIGIVFINNAIRNITGNIKKVTGVINSISSFDSTDNLPRISITSRDEIGDIVKAFNEMATVIEQHTRQQSESTQALNERHWLQSKVAETHELFQGVQNVKSFSSLLINWICQIVGASYGIFYVRSIEKGAVTLINMASYAGNSHEVGVVEFSPGEGLVGQCFLENRIINLTAAPDQYIEITTGFGKINPKYIKILPVEYEKKVVAVIELASLSEFSSLEREFLEQVRRNIGIILTRIEGHAQVQELLVESQALTEELQTQSEELQFQQEELKTFHEKLEEQYKKSEQKNIQLSQAKVSLEEQARQLTSSSHYKSEFLSNMSHELRTPLNSILILAKMLWYNNDGNLSAKQVEYAKTILSSGCDLLNLINDILDLAKIEAGKVYVYPEKIPLSELKEELERQFYPIAREKELDFLIQVDSDLPDYLITDRHNLKQILTNLLSNAFKFTNQGCVKMNIQRGSRVLLQERLSKLDNENTLFAFCVSDTGIGIAKDKHELIFEAFQQADGTTSRKYGGTGLGLSICRELATQIGGFLELKSSEGMGSTFTFILPSNSVEKTLVASDIRGVFGEAAVGLDFSTNQISVNTSDKKTEENVAQNTLVAGDLTGRIVLVVDDDMRNIFAISAALEPLKIKVLFAENGLEALKKFKENNDIDLILMDIMMPEMDGYETMKLIRQTPEIIDVPIIALTAKAMKGDREKCLEAGASDYISKPLDIDTLISLIRVWLYR